MEYHFEITLKDGKIINLYKTADNSQHAMRSLNEIPNVKSIKIISVKHVEV